jgi:hypothetical protein
MCGALLAALSHSTLNKAAAKCGCPVRGEGYLAFSMKAYATEFEAAACAPVGNPPVDTAVRAEANWVQGALTALQSPDGIESATGAVEFAQDVTTAADNSAAAEGSTFVRDGQMILRLVQKK